MTDRSRVDELVEKLLPRVPKHLRPSHLLDDAVVPPAHIADRVLALRELLVTGGRDTPLTGKLGSSRDVARHFIPRLRAQATESIWLVGLDIRHRVLVTRSIAQGGASACALSPRDVLRPLLLNNCSAFVIVHNHPSGDPAPSSEDTAITRRLADAGRLVGIELLDHVIVAAEGHFSFLDSGLLTR